MSSPRYYRSLGKHTLPLLVALLATRAPTSLAAQDTATVRPADTTLTRPDTAAHADTAATGQAGQNDMRPDSVPADSLRRDTAAARTGVPGAAPAPAPPPAPVDSALAVACAASGGGPPDLVTVVFRTTATAEEREAVARQVGGTLLQPSEHQAPGAWYIRVPGSAIDKSVADRLIMLPPVLEVGATRCPS